MQPRHRRAALLAALALAALACGPLRRGGGRPDAVIIFNNQSLAQADVFAVSSGGTRYRVGTVFAGRRDTLRVPSGAMGGGSTVSFVARLLATRGTPSSGPVTILPGDTLEVTLPSDGKLLGVLPARQP
ncbi:MAG TPA: hypothetical protein VKA84_05920 [Gemmatimonadaceae bacterium]|nr:hypothetical protein [Gemmatimonadaceae bacterium]